MIVTVVSAYVRLILGVRENALIKCKVIVTTLLTKTLFTLSVKSVKNSEIDGVTITLHLEPVPGVCYAVYAA